MQKLILVISLPIWMSGCLNTPLLTNVKEQAPTINDNNQTFTSQSLHWHVEKLARQLLSTSQPLDKVSTVAIGTILPSSQANGEPLPHDIELGIQIQESLMTFATQAGLQVVEYKTMPTIKITPSADKMLSRRVEDLNKSISADYFLTGTYTKQQTSTIINIRLVQIPDNIVLAAATDYVPNNAMWSDSKVQLQHQHVYRNSY